MAELVQGWDGWRWLESSAITAGRLVADASSSTQVPIGAVHAVDPDIGRRLCDGQEVSRVTEYLWKTGSFVERCRDCEALVADADNNG